MKINSLLSDIKPAWVCAWWKKNTWMQFFLSHTSTWCQIEGMLISFATFPLVLSYWAAGSGLYRKSLQLGSESSMIRTIIKILISCSVFFQMQSWGRPLQKTFQVKELIVFSAHMLELIWGYEPPTASWIHFLRCKPQSHLEMESIGFLPKKIRDKTTPCAKSVKCKKHQVWVLILTKHYVKYSYALHTFLH